MRIQRSVQCTHAEDEKAKRKQPKTLYYVMHGKSF